MVVEANSRRDLIAKLIHVLLALGLYKDNFEKEFLQSTTAYFKEDS